MSKKSKERIRIESRITELEAEIAIMVSDRETMISKIIFTDSLLEELRWIIEVMEVDK